MGFGTLAFPRFQVGQVLTTDDLNALVEYLEEENRNQRLLAVISLSLVALLLGLLCGRGRKG
ncbi:MAG: hypothetical protein ACR2NL_05265 [Acidimicrobiia bacterium]